MKRATRAWDSEIRQRWLRSWTDCHGPVEEAEVQERRARRFGSLVPLCAGHAYASLADARSSFGDNGGGGDGAPQRLISAWSSLRSTISSRPQRVFNARGHLIANEGYDEGKRLHLKL